LNDKDIAEINAALDEGKSFKEIAQDRGVNYNTLMSQIVRSGYETIQRLRPIRRKKAA
jgi:uncharacterized protein YidB (DUF937 family)